MSSYVKLQSGVEKHLQRAVAYVGPVSVAVDASNKAFRVTQRTVCTTLYLHGKLLKLIVCILHNTHTYIVTIVLGASATI